MWDDQELDLFFYNTIGDGDLRFAIPSAEKCNSSICCWESQPHTDWFQNNTFYCDTTVLTAAVPDDTHSENSCDEDEETDSSHSSHKVNTLVRGP